MSSLLVGKIGYACSVLPPRLKNSDPTNTLMSQLQVGINNVARATIGSKKSDRLKIEDLLSITGFPSLNRMTIYTIAMECWRALTLRDVPGGPLNPLGTLLSPPPDDNCDIVRSSCTRAATSGCIPPPAKHLVESFTWYGYTCWNSSSALRSATSISAAKRAAHELAAASPL